MSPNHQKSYRLVLAAMFLALALVLPFLTAIPGIILQLVLIPILVITLKKHTAAPPD